MTVTAATAEPIAPGPATPDPDEGGSSRWERLAVVAGVAVVILVLATTRARTLTEEDSINLALALHHYSVFLDQPQPPGYPLVVLAAHAFTWLGSVVSAYIMVAAIATVGMVIVTYQLGLEMFGRRAGVVAALIVCATPLALYYGEIVSVYPTEALMVPTVALLAHRIARRADRFSVFLLFPALAIGGGFRPEMLALMLPACAVGIVFGRPRIRDLAASALAGLAIVAAWGVPMVVKSGGWHNYSWDSSTLYNRQFKLTSLLYGADLHGIAFNAAIALGAIAMVTVPAALVAVLAFQRQKSAWRVRRPALWILVAALVPYLITFFAIQLGKPGYVLALLPILAVLAGGLVAHSSRALVVTGVVSVILVAGYLVLPQWPFPWRLDAFFPTAHAVHLQDEESLGLQSLAPSCPPRSCTMVSLPPSLHFWYHDTFGMYRWYAPNSRQVNIANVHADRASLGEVLWVGTIVPQAVRTLATPVGTFGTWSAYRSDKAVTAKIIKEAYP